MPFQAISDEDERELYRLSRIYWREARRCGRAGAHLAGCVMLGSALETLLILMVNVFTDEAEATGRIPTRKGMPKPLLEWELGELLRVAKAAKWLPTSDNPNHHFHLKKAKIGDFAELVRMVRNLAHPARYRKDHSGRRVTARYLRRQFDLVEISRDWLVTHNNKPLLEALRAGGDDGPHWVE
jgi:hypothetical protein